MRKAFIFIFLFNLGSFLSSQAQKTFLEGEITYTVEIENKDPDNKDLSIAQGEYRILLKGNSILKILRLKSGFSNTILYQANQNKVYSLRTIGKEKVAIELNMRQVQDNLDRCNAMQFDSLGSNIETIGGFSTERAILKCNDRSPIQICFTRDWNIRNKMLFEEFPSLTYLPLQYAITMSNGSVVKYTFKNIQLKPLDNSLFDIPKGYKKISYEEFKTWQH